MIDAINTEGPRDTEQRAAIDALLFTIRDSPFSVNLLDMNKILGEASGLGLDVRDCRQLDESVTVLVEEDPNRQHKSASAFTLVGGRLKEEEMVGNKQTFGGKPANFLSVFETKCENGPVVEVGRKEYYLPQTGGKVLSAERKYLPVPGSDKFYSSSYLLHHVASSPYSRGQPTNNPPPTPKSVK